MMNGKVAKRIRLAAKRAVVSNRYDKTKVYTYRRIYSILKKEYRQKPYYLRDAKYWGGYRAHGKRIADFRAVTSKPTT